MVEIEIKREYFALFNASEGEVSFREQALSTEIPKRPLKSLQQRTFGLYRHYYQQSSHRSRHPYKHRASIRCQELVAFLGGDICWDAGIPAAIAETGEGHDRKLKPFRGLEREYLHSWSR